MLNSYAIQIIYIVIFVIVILYFYYSIRIVVKTERQYRFPNL